MCVSCSDLSSLRRLAFLGIVADSRHGFVAPVPELRLLRVSFLGEELVVGFRWLPVLRRGQISNFRPGALRLIPAPVPHSPVTGLLTRQFSD